MTDSATEFRADPIDISGLTLDQLKDLPASSITCTLREILDLTRGESSVAGFDAFTGTVSTA
ncbi:hypothetical protein [Actinomadura sp. WMMB 499]|uniref:hypothetical protein n=1 Tax=Actinomadura sp. WMMB 499 TaxID=1219491 RepID=UPI0012466E44|nr:hypothetical protein [Actinomadura sp. WMMB 499]QFG24990.1 hypothetical protein F7P10_31510 [Actinomadura sp. WMMB 499]